MDGHGDGDGDGGSGERVPYFVTAMERTPEWECRG